MPRLAPVTTQTLSWSSRSIAAGEATAACALPRPAGAPVAALASSAGRCGDRAGRARRRRRATARSCRAPGPPTRAGAAAGAAPVRADARRRRRRPPSGPGQRYALRLPAGLGRLRDPGAGWAELARRDGCSRRGRVRDAPAADRARAHRARRPGAVAARGRSSAARRARARRCTEQRPAAGRRRASRGVVAADLHRMVAVLAQRAAGGPSGWARSSRACRASRARGRACDHRRVRLGADELGRLVAGTAARALLRDAV